MGANSGREYLVIPAGILIGALLMVSTIQQVRRARRFPLARVRLHPIEATARFMLGASFVLLAVFLLAGRTLWAGAASSTAPTWATPAGVVLLAGVLLSAIVVGVFALARRLRPNPR